MRLWKMRSTVAKWLAEYAEGVDQAARVEARAGDIVLCRWPRHFTLTVLLSTPF